MSKPTTNGFFEWVVSFFKKPKPVVVVEVPPTPEELELERQWKETRAKYRLEFLESVNLYFIQYHWKNQWWYLRRWDGDYTLERVRGNALRIEKPEQLDQVIYFHQDWIKEGHIYMPFE